MKRLCAITVLILAAVTLRAQTDTGFVASSGSTSVAQIDTTGFAKLEGMLEGYTTFIKGESIETKEEECDFLINSVTEAALRQKIAVTLFDIYRDSNLMGDESVAIYIWDSWLKDKNIAMYSEEQFSDARVFAEFNRASQLGMQAPELRLRKPCGGTETVPAAGKPAILFFYDTGCAKCKMETAVFPEMLKSWTTPVTFCAIYVGMDAKAWKQWRKSFKLNNPKIKVKHFWDPDLESDLVRNYAVLSTPKLYLIKSDGRVLGRRLEVENLLQLEQYLDQKM